MARTIALPMLLPRELLHRDQGSGARVDDNALSIALHLVSLEEQRATKPSSPDALRAIQRALAP